MLSVCVQQVDIRYKVFQWSFCIDQATAYYQNARNYNRSITSKVLDDLSPEPPGHSVIVDFVMTKSTKNHAGVCRSPRNPLNAR